MSNGTPAGGAAQSPGLADQAQDVAANLTKAAKDRTTGLVEEQKAAAADQVEDVARFLDEVAGRAEQGAPGVTPLLREAASSIHRVSSQLRDRSVDEVLQDFSEFARRRPATLIGASLLGGFALARFLKSSADRRAARGEAPSGSFRAGRPAVDRSSRRMAAPAASPVADERSGPPLANDASHASGTSPITDGAHGEKNKPVATFNLSSGPAIPDHGAL